MFAEIDGKYASLELPDPHEEVLPGVLWGAFDELMTPAYWRGQAWQHEALGTYACFRLGRTLAEETAACLLGGYGMPAELGLEAYVRLRADGLLDGFPSQDTLERRLSEPFLILGRARRYRFPRQKAAYLAACLTALGELQEPEDDVDLRNLLATLSGIGPKTASWIVRNYRASDRVAVLDIHILRAGRCMSLFNGAHTPERHYPKLEETFLSFARALPTAAAMLDSMMWDYMRRMPMRRSETAGQLDLFVSLAV